MCTAMFFGSFALRNLWIHAWNSLYTRKIIMIHEITMVTICIGLLNTWAMSHGIGSLKFANFK